MTISAPINQLTNSMRIPTLPAPYRVAAKAPDAEIARRGRKSVDTVARVRHELGILARRPASVATSAGLCVHIVRAPNKDLRRALPQVDPKSRAIFEPRVLQPKPASFSDLLRCLGMTNQESRGASGGRSKRCVARSPAPTVHDEQRLAHRATAANPSAGYTRKQRSIEDGACHASGRCLGSLDGSALSGRWRNNHRPPSRFERRNRFEDLPETWTVLRPWSFPSPHEPARSGAQVPRSAPEPLRREGEQIRFLCGRTWDSGRTRSPAGVNGEAAAPASARAAPSQHRAQGARACPHHHIPCTWNGKLTRMWPSASV